MTADEGAVAQKVPEAGDLLSFEGQFLKIKEVQPQLDGAFVVAEATSAEAAADGGVTTVSCKLADLFVSGEVAGTTIWGRA